MSKKIFNKLFGKTPKKAHRVDNISAYQYDIISDKLDVDYYISSNQGLADIAQKNSDFDPVLHYMQHGAIAGYNPHPRFSTSYYIYNNKDVAESDQNPFFHYIKHGEVEGRAPYFSWRGESIWEYDGSGPSLEARLWSSSAINTEYEVISKHIDHEYYISQYSDVEYARKSDPNFDIAYHYISHGCKESRNPTDYFSTEYYHRLNADVRKAQVNPFYHYLIAGKSEGRTGKQAIVRRHLPIKGSPRVLFVGHAGQFAGAEVMLRDTLEWFANHTSYVIDIIVMEYGPIVESYAVYGNVYVLDRVNDTEFCRQNGLHLLKYDYIYCNTVVSGAVSHLLSELYGENLPPIVLHVHEMKEVITANRSSLESIRPYVTQYVAASRSVKQDLVGSFEINSDSVYTFESFIKVSASTIDEVATARQAARDKLGLSHNSFVIIGGGTVYPRKSPDIFVETLRILLQKNADSNVVGVWMGDGPDYHAICDWVHSLGLKDKIRFIGHQANMRQLVAAADVFFLPSREDPFPLVCLEAAQYAVPTIYFKGKTGIDAFTRDDAGFGLERFSAEAAASAVAKLMYDRSAIDIAGLNARIRVLRQNNQSHSVPQIFHFLRRQFDIKPTLSVIVPNYNHEKFLTERIESILSQRYADMEIILLDDASTDDSVSVLKSYLYDPRVSLHVNEVGTGSPFVQWRRGADLARADFLWIAESDDSCSDNFIEVLLPSFQADGTNIAHAKTININENGEKNYLALELYLRNAAGTAFEQNYWHKGSEEVEKCMAFACTIVNISGTIVRKSALQEAISLSHGFKMCGDWIVYLGMLKTGSISYSTNTLNMFRRHSNSVVSKLEGTDTYFEERLKIAKYIKENFYVSGMALNKMHFEIEKEYKRFKHVPKTGDVASLIKNVSLRSRGDRDRRLLRNIAFYVHGMTFSRGGIERQAAEIANHLSRIGHRVFMFCGVSGSTSPVYQLDGDIKVIPVFDPNRVDESIERLRKSIVNLGIEIFIPMMSEDLFDPIVSSADGLNVIKIVSEHNDPWVIEEKWWNRQGRQACFAKADVIHLLLEKFKGSLEEDLRRKAVVIPNGVPRVGGPRADLSVVKGRIIAIGRLVEQKNFDALVRAFGVVAPKFNDWNLYIYGEGPERPALQHRIEELKLKNRVYMPGEVEDIHSELMKSDFMVVPSLFEGFSIVVAEAKRAGIPSIAYVSCNGPNELIVDGVSGLLVDAKASSDASGRSLSRAIEMLIKDHELRIKMGEEASKSFDKYDMNAILDRWESLVNTLVLKDINRSDC